MGHAHALTVDLRILAHDVQPNLLAKGARDIAHHARKGLHTIGEGPHAAGQRPVIEPVREIRGARVECLDLIIPLR